MKHPYTSTTTLFGFAVVNCLVIAWAYVEIYGAVNRADEQDTQQLQYLSDIEESVVRMEQNAAAITAFASQMSDAEGTFVEVLHAAERYDCDRAQGEWVDGYGCTLEVID